MREDEPLRDVFWLIGLQVGVLLLASAVTQRALHFVNFMFLGVDYLQYFDAARAFLEGKTPYHIGGFVTPPPSALLQIPLVSLGFDVAKYVILGINIAALPLALGVFTRVWLGRGDKERWAYVGGILLFSFPVFFLLNRGNMDGLVLLLLSLFFLFLLLSREGWAGALLALAVGLKLYPALLFLPLLIFRRYRVVGSALVVLGVFVLLAPGAWRDYLMGRLWERGAVFTTRENVSIMSTLFFLGRLVNRMAALGGIRVDVAPVAKDVVAPVVYLLALGLNVWADVLQRHASPSRIGERLLPYFPFMVVIPPLTFAYELVLLLPLVPWLVHVWHREVNRWARVALWCALIGVAFSQFQVVGWVSLVGRWTPYFLGGWGAFLTLLGVTGWKWFTLEPGGIGKG